MLCWFEIMVALSVPTTVLGPFISKHLMFSFILLKGVLESSHQSWQLAEKPLLSPSRMVVIEIFLQRGQNCRISEQIEYVHFN